MEAMLIVNPSSGGAQAQAYREKVVRAMQQHYQNVYVRLTEGEGDATRFAIEASDKGCAAVYSMGGDGTVNEVVAGLSQCDHTPNYGILPFGTVNDVARALGIPLDLDEAIEMIGHEEVLSLDVGTVNGTYFTNVVAIGTLPTAVQNVSVEQKTRFGSLAYIWNGIKSMFRSKRKSYVLELDGETFLLKSELVLFLLTKSVGGFEFITPEAQIGDGYLHCVAVTAKNLAETMSILPSIIGGNATDAQHVFYKKFKTGYLSQVRDSDTRANVDGDEGPTLPLELSVLPQRLKALVPKREAHHEGV